MRFEQLRSDVLMFVGDEYESVATAFLDGDDVLLVDSLASVRDAQWMRRVLCEDMGKTVRAIAATHFMSDHIAGLSLFPEALTIAHRHHRHTFLSQNRRVDDFCREPRMVFDSAMTLRWGQHELSFLYNPGREADERIASIRIEACLAPQVEAAAFEREWHQHNLEVIVAQSVFAFDTAIASRLRT